MHKASNQACYYTEVLAKISFMVFCTVLKMSLGWGTINIKTNCVVINVSPISGPCQHGTARPRVADGGKTSNVEGICEYIEQAIVDSR